MFKVKIPKYANAEVSVHSLTIGELDKRRAMLKSIKRKVSKETYDEIRDIFLW